MLTLRRTATVAAAALALTLTACATQTTPASQAGEAGESNGVPTLHLAIGGEPDDGFDPTLGWAAMARPCSSPRSCSATPTSTSSWISPRTTR